MDESFKHILAIARENIAHNPSLKGKTPAELGAQYLRGLSDEVEEVAPELKEQNQVFLTDELSDIAWDYVCLLAALEAGGYIESAETVLAHGLKKYTERAPAFLTHGEEAWEAVKKKQKEALKEQHQEKYGN